MCNDLRLTTLWRRVRFLFFGLAISTTLSYACGPEWTFLGEAAPTLSAVRLPGGNGAILAGTVSGIYRWTESEPQWQHEALSDWVRQFVPTVTPSDSLYAVAHDALYLSPDNGETWEMSWEGPLGGGMYMQALAISPHDPAQRVISCVNGDETGFLYASHDAGENWGFVRVGVQGYAGLAFSPSLPPSVYFAEAAWFGRIDLADSSRHNLRQYRADVNRILRHPRNAWIYVLTRDTISLFDEVLDTLAFLAVPELVGIALDMAIDSQANLLIGGWNGVALVDETLSAWVDVSNDLDSGRPLFSNGTTWLVDWTEGIYCRDPELAIETVGRPTRSSALRIGPNPVSDWLTVWTDGEAHLSLYNVLGQLVARAVKTGPTSPTHIPVSELPAGVYFMQAIDSKNRAICQRVTITH